MALWNSYQHQLRESRRNVRELDISGRAPHEAFDDGAFCTMGETCTTGSCGGGSAVTVDDRVGCTDYSCDEALDVVMNITNDAIPGCSISAPVASDNGRIVLVMILALVALGWIGISKGHSRH